MSVNKAILIGRLGKDPELRHTQNQIAVCTLNLATSERRKDASGNWNEQTEWHNVVVFGKTAENCAQYLAKGRQVYVEGRIQTRKWQDKEGKDRYTTEIVGNTVQFIGSKADGAGGGSYAGASNSGGSYGGASAKPANANSNVDSLLNSLPSAEAMTKDVEVSFDDDDIPF